MPIRFACPNPQCGKTIVVKDEFAGRTGKCPGCANPVKIPAPMPAFEVVEDDEIVPPPPPPPKKKPVVVVDEEDAPKPKKKPTIVVEDEDTPKPKKRPTVVVEDEEDAPKPKKKPVVVVEDEAPAPKAKKPAVVVEDDDAPPPPKKKPAVVVEDAEEAAPAPAAKKKPAVVVEDADEVPPPPKPAKKLSESSIHAAVEPAAPAKGMPVLRKAAPPADYDDEVLGRTTWYVRKDKGLFAGKTHAALFETAEDKKPYAVVRDATFKLFGFIDVEAFGWKPRFKYQLRGDNKDGPVLLTIERFVPRFDSPFMTPKPVRWEVRGPDDAVVGSITLSRVGFSWLKFLTKGQFFQDEHFLLDGDGGRCGSITVERSKMAAPTRIAIIDGDGNEYGNFTTQMGKQLKSAIDEMKETGKRKIMTSVSVLGKGDEAWRGVYGHVGPDRETDSYSRVMTLAMAILLENLGYQPFMGSRTAKK